MKSTTATHGAIEISMDQFDRLVERLKALGADEKDTEVLQALFSSYESLTELIQDKRTTIRRLRELLHGATTKPKTEKTRNVVGQTAASPASPGAAPQSKPKRKGHGRNGAERYVGAERIAVPHESLHPGDPCPHCRGRVYAKKPVLLVRIRASAPFPARLYEKERLRCNLCGEVFTAPSPDGIGEDRYDESVASMVGLLRYGSGLPFHRIEGLQASLGVPLSASVQWELVRDATPLLRPAHDELLRLAAQGELLFNDDTAMRVLEYLNRDREQLARGEKLERTGTFTSGIVSVVDGRQIVLYFTGRRHAGENLAELLAQRASGLDPPLQMCDGLERNLPGELKTIVSNCLVHGRRHFVDVVQSFPAEVRHVLEELGTVYRNDAHARSEGLSPEERLRWHQQESAPVMERLKEWMDALIRDKAVEPNSGLGKAIAYLDKRWERMTLFLRKPGVPLDNSLCERMLKRAILHRKNSLFYKTENGARVGDLYMSLIATARLAEVDPFDYLIELQRHKQELAAHPADWMPWNYRSTLARTREPT